jgi:hypothetical protein
MNTWPESVKLFTNDIGRLSAHSALTAQRGRAPVGVRRNPDHHWEAFVIAVTGLLRTLRRSRRCLALCTNLQFGETARGHRRQLSRPPRRLLPSKARRHRSSYGGCHGARAGRQSGADAGDFYHRAGRCVARRNSWLGGRGTGRDARQSWR